MRPATIQLELTYSCNNLCDFCYNRWSIGRDSQISYERLQKTLVDIYQYGVFSINFNGGEPLLYERFFDIAQYAAKMGFDIHCNTNATLITSDIAKNIARLFPAICTSLYSANAKNHDVIVGRIGAFRDTIVGIERLVAENVYVAVNITLSQNNLREFIDILKMLASLKVGTLLVSRVLTDNPTLAVNDEAMCAAIQQVKNYQDATHSFGRIAFPQPFPPCKCADSSLRAFINQGNVTCSAGMLTARITPDGRVTPCPVMEMPVIGNCKNKPFSSIWNCFEQNAWRKAMPKTDCEQCDDLPCCGGGCLPQTMSGILLDKEQ